MKKLFIIVSMMSLFSSCNNNIVNDPIELQKQQIGITSAHNARQLGGYCIGNMQIKEDLLLRTARLSALSSEDSVLLADKFKVQCIYDFRGKEESESAPDVIPGDSRYLSLSISFTSGETSAYAGRGTDEEMVKMLLAYADDPRVQAMCDGMYDKIFLDESSHEVYRRFFADLVALDPADGAVLWHCTQGKDRAGAASAMILAALGANRELIMADFTLSKEYYDPHISQIPVQTDSQRKVVSTLLSVNPEIFAMTLDKIDAKYGSLRNYLTECIGVTPEMMDTLRSKYLR